MLVELELPLLVDFELVSDWAVELELLEDGLDGLVVELADVALATVELELELWLVVLGELCDVVDGLEELCEVVDVLTLWAVELLDRLELDGLDELDRATVELDSDIVDADVVLGELTLVVDSDVYDRLESELMETLVVEFTDEEVLVVELEDSDELALVVELIELEDSDDSSSLGPALSSGRAAELKQRRNSRKEPAVSLLPEIATVMA